MAPHRLVVAVGLSLGAAVAAWLCSIRGLEDGGPQVQPVASAAKVSQPGDPLRSTRPAAPGHGPGTRPDEGLVTHPSVDGLPPWAVPFGGEFWRKASADADKGDFRLGEVVERVSCAFSAGPGSVAARVVAGAYEAVLDPKGLRFTQGGSARGRSDDGTSRAGATFRTLGISRGGDVIFADSGAGRQWHLLGNTAQALLSSRDGLVEHHEARHEGLEMSWVLSQPLSGVGDLVIRLGVSGIKGTRATDSGVHLVDASGRCTIRVGKVRAVDRRGAVWDVAALAGEGSVEYRVPANVLGIAEYPLAIDPLISAQFDVDQPVEGPWSCTRSSPAVAAGASNYLVVWTQGRGEAVEPAVRAARVDRQGQLLDPYGVLVSAVASEQTTCSVAANPGGFLVVWSALRGTSTVDWDVLGARIGEDGTLMDVSPFPVCALANTVQNSPSVAGNGDNYLVAWRDSRSTGIYGTVVGRDGRVGSTNGMVICNAANEQFLPSVASAGGEYLVVWQDYRKASSSVFHSDIYGARVTGLGVLMDTNGIALCTRTNSQYHPVAAGGPGGFLVAWEDYDLAGNNIQGTRVGLDGAVLDPAGILIGQGSNAQANPVIAALADGFIVAWQDFRGSTNGELAGAIFGTRVDQAGQVLDPDGVVLSPGSRNCGVASIAGHDDEALVAWQGFGEERQPTLTEVRATRVASVSGWRLEDDFGVPRSLNAQSAPAVAPLGDGYLVVWADNRNGLDAGLDIYGARVVRDGVVLDPSGIPICLAPGRQFDPAVAGRGTNCLVTWTDGRNSPAAAFQGDIYGILVGSNGMVTPGGPFPISVATNDQGLAAVSATADGFFAVWQDARSTPASLVRYDVYGTRLDSEGRVIDSTGLPICTNVADQRTPAVASSSDGVVVVWADFRNGSTSDIYGAHVNGEGVLLETNGLEICRAAGNQSVPVVAPGGSGHLVVWADARGGTATPDIYGAWIGALGVAPPTNGFPIQVAPGSQTAPAIASLGWDCLVTWQSNAADPMASSDLVGTRVPGDGSAPVGSGFVIDGGSQNLLGPGVAVAEGGLSLIVSQGAPHGLGRTAAWVSEVASQARLDSGGLDSDGHFGFRIWGAAGSSYRVESTEDLRVWTSRQVIELQAGQAWFKDTSSTPGSARFYRVIHLP